MAATFVGDSIARDDEAEKMEVGASPSTLLPLELQIMLSYAIEDFSERVNPVVFQLSLPPTLR